MPAAIGSYRILRLLGEGGMGAVYEAEQEKPRRTVALKVIKAAWAGPELIRRFEQESQALGRLHHPGIAQIYEAGAADTGFGLQPFFAMEIIHGQPLVEYANAQHLSTRRRLVLMIQICEAVEHAHQRGIVHRDLKPGNILVDENGRPKILDFGLARVTDSDAQATRQTDMGQLLGTLAYMSPEQVLADPLAIDTRSDVYSLGVILYELLAGKLPYTLSRYLHEAVRAIREQDPIPLSAVSRTYRGDIETIVTKALEKDKERRYASAADLAADIRRYLDDEPIVARPPSATYQMQKFTRRHKALVAGVAAVVVVLVAGVVASTWEAVRARRAAATAEALNDFLQNDLLAQASAANQSGPSTRPDPDLKVRTALDRAAARIGGKFDKQPEVEAAIRGTIGETYHDLGLYPGARKQLERALELDRKFLGAENPKTLRIMRDLARTAMEQGKYPESEALYSQALEISRRVLGSEHPDTLDAMRGLATNYFYERKYPQAEPIYKQIVNVSRRVLGPDHPDTLRYITGLASVYHQQAKYAQAETLYRQTLDARRKVLGPEHPDTLTALSNLAVTYEAEGKHAEAEDLDVQVLETRRRLLGPEHPDTLNSTANLEDVYFNEGKYAQAEVLASQVFEISRRRLGPEHPDTVRYMGNLAAAYDNDGKYAQAEALYGQDLDLSRRVLGPEDTNTLYAMASLGSTYADDRKYSQAEPLLLQTLEIKRRVLGPETPDTLFTLGDIACMYQQQGKFAQAEAYAAQALAGRRHALGNENPATMASAADLALAYLSQGKFAESQPLAREAMETDKKIQPDHWQRFRAETLLGASLAGQKRCAEAEPLLLEGYQGMLARKQWIEVSSLYHLARAREWIVQLYADWGKPGKAAQWRQELHPS
ncbi:MAG: tetratricopeptide repeat protein [Thermoanaerobaculales bacterium]